MAYLRALLAAPGREITALDLVAGGAGLAAAAAEPVLDTAARDAYRRRLAALDDVLDAADAVGDSVRAQQAATERDALLGELRRATGLGGRDRGVPGADERARVNVTRTLRATLDRITDAAPKAGAHLSASIRTGRACRYQPAPAARAAGASDTPYESFAPDLRLLVEPVPQGGIHEHHSARGPAGPHRRALRR